MLNEVVLIGRLVETPKLNFTKSETKVCNITLAVVRPYKNENGEYDADFIDCTLWDGVASNVAEYCKKGDLVAIKGRVQTRYVEKEDNSKKKYMEIVGEKVTFLAQSKEKDNE